jgi:hypothetical protein
MTDLDNGNDLHALMDRALVDLPVPTDRLYGGAVRRGRPLRRRRRAGAALGALALAAAAVVVTLPAVTGGEGDAGGVATDPHPQRASPQPFVSHPGWWDMPVGPMRERLAALLPPRVTIADFERLNTDHGPGESAVLHGVLTGTLRNASDIGPGSIEIFLTELPQDPVARADLRAQHLSCDPHTRNIVDVDGPVQCRTSDVRDGQPYERTVTFTDQGVTYSVVYRWSGDGEIYAATANSTQRKWGPPASAVHPPLTLPQLAAIAESPTWTTWPSD